MGPLPAGHEPIYLPGVRPALVDLDRPPPPLPVPLTPLFGRSAEVEHACALLSGEDVRLLTLTGPGGVGKTRLALRIAAAVGDDVAGGVWFVPLAQVSDPELVARAIVQTLGLGDAEDLLPGGRFALSLRDRPLLLILDNFEQVAAASPLVHDLLASFPSLKILVTSRVALRIEGEQEYPVPPLALPDPRRRPPLDDLATVPAVALFVYRARAVDPTAALTEENAGAVAELCARLDGLPLAIELAAAHWKLLPPRAMVSLLTDRFALLARGGRDRPARHQTMRAAIAWSYDLLSPAEQALFRRLAVFAGGFPLEAAQAVGGGGDRSSRSPSVLDLVGTLVDKSLLRPERAINGGRRLAMLETVRDFAAEQLAASGEGDEARRRHADWCLSLAERFAPSSGGTGSGARGAPLDAELDNLRAALTTLEAGGDPGPLLRLIAALEPLWTGLGHEREGFGWLTRAFELGGSVPADLRTRCVILGSRLAVSLCDFPAATAWAEEAAVLASIAADAPGLADAVCLLGNIARGLDDQAAARARYEEALGHYRALGDRPNVAYTLIQLAKLGDLGGVDRRGDPGAQALAVARCEEALGVYRALGDPGGVARALHQLGHVTYRRREYPRAARIASEALAIRWEHRNTTEAASCFEDLADIAGMTGHAETASCLYGVAEALRETHGVPIWPAYRADHDREVDVTRRALPPEVFAASWASGRALSLEDAVACAQAFANGLATSGPAPASGAVRPARPAGMETVASGLTPRELEVLRLLVAGRSNPEIATALYISTRTAQTHVQHIFDKLDVDSRSEAVAFAVRHLLV